MTRIEPYIAFPPCEGRVLHEIEYDERYLFG
jgi:hypothetical protein